MKEKCEPTEMLFVFIKSELSKSFAQSGAAEFLFFFGRCEICFTGVIKRLTKINRTRIWKRMLANQTSQQRKFVIIFKPCAITICLIYEK